MSLKFIMILAVIVLLATSLILIDVAIALDSPKIAMIAFAEIVIASLICVYILPERKKPVIHN